MRRFVNTLLLLFLSMAITLSASAVVDLNDGGALMILDTPTSTEFARKFRYTGDLINDPSINTTGFSELKLYGSGVPDATHFKAFREAVEGPILIIDLRQESHAYVNGLSVSLFTLHNWVNKGMTNAEVDLRELQLCDTIAEQQSLYLHQILTKEDEGAVLRVIIHNLSVDYVETEEEVVSACGMEYLRIYITDHFPPRPEEVDRLVAAIEAMPDDSTFYFHCRAGKGRTTTAMVVYDILRNAGKVTFEEIVQRHHALGGTNLLARASENSYKQVINLERIQFLRDFYQYVEQRGGLTWSQWLLHSEPILK